MFQHLGLPKEDAKRSADALRYAGLAEYEAYQDRSVNGLPYHPEVIEWFRRKTAELGLEGLRVESLG